MTHFLYPPHPSLIHELGDYVSGTEQSLRIGISLDLDTVLIKVINTLFGSESGRETYLEERAHTLDSMRLSSATAAEFHVFLGSLSLNIPPGEETSRPPTPLSPVSRLQWKKTIDCCYCCSSFFEPKSFHQSSVRNNQFLLQPWCFFVVVHLVN